LIYAIAIHFKITKKSFSNSNCFQFAFFLFTGITVQIIPTKYQSLSIESWSVVNNGKHNAFTDLIYWKGEFYLTYRIADFHSGSIKSKIVIMSSPDAKKWKE